MWRGIEPVKPDFTVFRRGNHFRDGASLPYGFGYRNDDVAKLIAAPFWLICLFLVCLDVVLLRRWFRGRHGVGLCPACNYDLRATPRRCPECGWEAAGAAREIAEPPRG